MAESRVINDSAIRLLLRNNVSLKVLGELEEPASAADVAERLGYSQQRVRYYISKLLKLKLIKKVGKAGRRSIFQQSFEDEVQIGLLNAGEKTAEPVFWPHHAFFEEIMQALDAVVEKMLLNRDLDKPLVALMRTSNLASAGPLLVKRQTVIEAPQMAAMKNFLEQLEAPIGVTDEAYLGAKAIVAICVVPLEGR